MNYLRMSFILFLSIISFFAFGQQECGTDFLLNQTLQQNPVFRQRHLQLEQDIYNQMNQQSQGVGYRRSNGSYVLPVVVHVIHNNGSENIPDSMVQRGINYINEAFANIGSYNTSGGVNTNIQFCLAKQTPQAGLTNGIVRVQSSLTDLDMSQDLQMKNLSRWNPLCYVNIWLVKEICNQNGCGVAGYAYLPGAHGRNMDGLVVEARLFGSNPGNTTPIHELGHYLGLYHTFDGGCTNNDCLQDGDRVCDTPPDQSTAAIACSGTSNSCSTDTQSGLTTDQPDNHQNFLDYGFSFCRNNYSQGQGDRMQWHIDNVRYSLLNCPSCNTPCTTAIAALFSVPFNNIAVGNSVTFTNQSTNAATYNWLINGQSFSTSASPSYNFNTEGTYIIRLQTTGADTNCISFFSDTITATCGIVAGMAQSTTSVNVGGQVTFTNTSTGGISFSWYVDGVLRSNSSTTYAHTFSVSGTYPVYLIASGAVCSDTTSLTFIQVGTPCNVSFTQSPQQATTCLPVTFTPDTGCSYTNYTWTFCDPSNFAVPSVQNYPVTGPLPAGAKLLKDHNGNYHAFYSVYSTSSSFVNTVYRLDFGNSVNNTPTLHAIYTPSITETYAHGMDMVYDGGRYYGFAIYYNSIYRFDFGYSVANDTPAVVQLSGFTASNLNWASKIEVVRETNTWWLLVVARNGGFNVLYLGNNITGNVQNHYYSQCPSCWGFAYQKVNGNHYVFVTNVFDGMKRMAFGNSLANTPTSTAFTMYGTGYHGDVALYQNCDGSFDGVILKENTATHTIIHLDSVTAAPAIIVNSFSNGLTRTGSCGRIMTTDAGLTLFTAIAYGTTSMTKLVFPDCGISYSASKFPAPVYYPQAGNYYVKLSVDEGLASQQSYCMNVNVAAITAQPLDLGPDVITCENAAQTLDAGAGFSSYLWDDGSTDQIRTTFFPGTYWVETTDSCNASYHDTITVSVDNSTSIVLNDATICAGTSVMLVAPSGFASYLWTPATGLGCATCSTTIATPGDTTAYTITAFTANGCVNSASAIINVNDCGTNLPLTALLSSVNVSCTGGTDGSVSVTVSGGKPPYTYLWNTGHTTATVSSLLTGSYSVTVSDSVGTAIISNIFINAPAPLIVITASFTQRVTCFGDSTGAAKVFGNGGTSPYSYSWNNGHTGDSPTGLAAGIHMVTVTDARGCTASSNINILEGASLNTGQIFGPDTVDINVPEQFIVNSGYDYVWLCDGAVVSGQGTYAATIDWGLEGTDTIIVIASTLGCADTLWKAVTLLNLTGIDEVSLSGIELFPNPNSGKTTIRAQGVRHETVLSLFDAVGKMIFEKTVSSSEMQTGAELDLSLVSEGIYFLNVKTGNEMKVMKVVRY